MRRVALDFCGAAVFDCDQHSAGVWTIMRAGGMNNFFHDATIIRENLKIFV